MNRDRMRQVADRIDLEGRFNYTDFVQEAGAEFEPAEWNEDFDFTLDLKRLYKCGTVGCVAGWAGLIALEQGQVPTENDAWVSFAARWLGLTAHEAERLFFAWIVPEWYSEPPEGQCWGMNATEAAKMLRQIADGEITIPNEEVKYCESV